MVLLLCASIVHTVSGETQTVPIRCSRGDDKSTRQAFVTITRTTMLTLKGDISGLNGDDLTAEMAERRDMGEVMDEVILLAWQFVPRDAKVTGNLRDRSPDSAGQGTPVDVSSDSQTSDDGGDGPTLKSRKYSGQDTLSSGRMFPTAEQTVESDLDRLLRDDSMSNIAGTPRHLTDDEYDTNRSGKSRDKSETLVDSEAGSDAAHASPRSTSWTSSPATGHGSRDARIKKHPSSKSSRVAPMPHAVEEVSTQ